MATTLPTGARGRTPEELQELLKEVRRIQVQSRRLVTGVLSGAFRSVFRGAGLEFDEVREYVEGDDPRAVDPGVSARLGRPFVKTFVDERELPVLFLLDLSASMDAGLGAVSPREMATRVTACLALSAVTSAERIGLVACGAGYEHVVPPRKGGAHALRILRDCLALPAPPAPAGLGAGAGDAAPAPLTLGLQHLLRAAHRRSILFVLSDFLCEGWQRPLRAVSRRHDLVAVRLAPPELELPRAGLLRLRDPEGGAARVLDLADPAVRRDHAERVQAWRTRTDRTLRRARVDVMDVPVPRVLEPGSVSKPLLRFFRMRQGRGGGR